MYTCSETRRWIERLAPLSLFESKEVPGSPAAVRAMLSRMAANPERSGIERVHRGLYFKQDDFPGIDYNVNDVVRAACRVAGPGSGMTGYTALNQLWWVWQVPNAVYLITVADRLPSTPLLPWVKWRLLPDAKHRLELSVAECTVLEAVRLAGWVEQDWEEVILEEIANPERRGLFWPAINRLQDGLRPDALREAALLEKPTDGEIKCIEHQATDLSKPLPERIQDVATAIETRYRIEPEKAASV